MNVLAMCITWNRPQLLGRSIHCFLQQTDPNGRLFILDDAGQYKSQEHDRWTLVSVRRRYPTMGQKRNALLQMAIRQYPEIEGFMLWDDDDVYFPHAIKCVSTALNHKRWAQPRYALELDKKKWGYTVVETFSRREKRDKSYCYGGCWAWRIDTFMEFGEFEITNSGEDMKLAKPCYEKYGPSANSTPNSPWYYYNRENNSIVGEGLDFYTLRGKQKIEPIRELSVGWNGQDMYQIPILPGIHPRPW